MKDIVIYYRTTEMMVTPNLYVERSEKFPEILALGVTFAPSFDEGVVRKYRKFVEEEVPEKLAIEGSDFHFVFILDRSGSMEGKNMVVAREALKLFMQSLPTDCQFSIISFGDRFELHKNLMPKEPSQTGVYDYSDDVLE